MSARAAVLDRDHAAAGASSVGKKSSCCAFSKSSGIKRYLCFHRDCEAEGAVTVL